MVDFGRFPFLGKRPSVPAFFIIPSEGWMKHCSEGNGEMRGNSRILHDTGFIRPLIRFAAWQPLMKSNINRCKRPINIIQEDN
jgi:hypothetical protein